MKVFLCLVTLLCLPLMCVSQGYEFHQAQCKDQGSFYIVENQPTLLACSGLEEHHKIYWAITYPNGSEIRIGECSNCTVCGRACTTFSNDYVVARTQIYSTLHFKHNLEANGGAVVKCSRVDYSIEKICTINVIKPCRNNHLVLLFRYAPIQCQGLQSSQGMYWEIVYSDGTTRSIANCERCRTGHNCPACSVNDNYFTVIRTPTYSTLKIVGNDELYNQTTLRCSSTDETVSVACNVSLSYYRMSQCTNGVLEISEKQPHRAIYCEGLHDTDVMFWKKMDLAVPPVHVAMRSAEPESFSCSSVNDKVAVSRNATVSQLVIRNYTREDWAKKTLICTKNDGAELDTCRIRIIYPVQLGNSTVSVHDDFTVTAQVEIEKMYDSDFNVICVWYIVTENKIKLPQTTRPSLSTFTERDDGPKFYRGSCSVTMDAPSEEGHYLVHVKVMPEPGLKEVGDFNIRERRNGSCTLISGAVGGSLSLLLMVVVAVAICKNIICRRMGTAGQESSNLYDDISELHVAQQQHLASSPSMPVQSNPVEYRRQLPDAGVPISSSRQDDPQEQEMTELGAAHSYEEPYTLLQRTRGSEYHRYSDLMTSTPVDNIDLESR